MAWTSLAVNVAGNAADAWSDALLEAGAISVDVADAAAGTPDEAPQFGEPGEMVPGAWDRNIVTALFGPAHDPQHMVESIAEVLGSAVPHVTTAIVEEQDWVRLTQSQFEPIRISSRIWILPSWHVAVDADAINLVIDPGLAFGTGSHPTTRLCLQWLEDNVRGGDRVLDYGCGSGILAIAARRLGAAQVIGTDVDPQALESSRANAAINRVECIFVEPDALDDQTCDVVVANILTNPLRMLAPSLGQRTRIGGRIVLSGILADQVPSVIDAYLPWFNMDVWRLDDGWAALAGARR